MNCSVDGNVKSALLNGTIGNAIHLAGPGQLAVKWWGLYDNCANSQPPPAAKVKYWGTWNVKYWGTWNMMTLVWLFAMSGMIVACIIYHIFSSEHYRHFEDMLVNMCDERARMLQQQFGVSMNHVHALAILVSTFHLGKKPSALDQKSFAEYTARTSFERPLMTGVAYAQKILHSEREVFEKEHGWTIKNMHSKDLNPIQDEYVPTVFAQDTIGYLISLDMMSGEEDRENILRARASGKGVLTSPFKLLESNHLGVVLTFAVYEKELPADATVEERIEAAAGYLGGAFDVESLVENLLCQLAQNEAIIVNVYDITNSSRPLIMYGPDTSTVSTLSRVSPLDFGDPFRKHEMHCRLAREIPLPKLAIGFASGVLALVALICYMVYNAHIHVKKVVEDYRKMEELKKRAEAADIAKSQFLATVSHEIRTPMNGVLGMLRMLMDTELDATQQDFARTAQASGRSLITLINEVLDQAKIESGRIELEAVPFDLRAILDDIVSLFSGKTRDKGIELAVFVSERVPEILIGDPGRFRQVITNLVGNSVKFTERGHIFVCVHLWDDVESVQVGNKESFSKEFTEAWPKNYSMVSCNTFSGFVAINNQNSWDTFKLLLENGSSKQMTSNSLNVSDTVKLFLSVEDTGVGIPLQAQQRIFMPFMQADSSTSRTYGGTGIGLSISKCLVELMNGELKFETKEDVGTTFTCTVVLKRWHGSIFSDTKRPPNNPLPSSFKGMKAVIVDGRPVRSEVTKYHVQRLGVEVKTVYDCKQALQQLLEGTDCSHSSATGNLDMVLVDKDAWGVSTGLSFPFLLKEVCQRKGIRKLPKMILLATSITGVESEKSKAMGYLDTVVMKPLRASMIAACLQRALGIGSKGPQGRLLEEPPNLRNLLYGKRILVVDDNRVNCRVASGALQKYGAHVECADSGKAAIAMLQPPHKFDACFMDIQMPEMDGFEATRQIRRTEQLHNEQDCKKASDSLVQRGSEWHVPILAMTADVFQATHEECTRCGMDGYVSKPFEEEQLYRAVTQFFDSKMTS
eukprot:c28605_g2_i3 orf=278-3370(+)